MTDTEKIVKSVLAKRRGGGNGGRSEMQEKLDYVRGQTEGIAVTAMGTSPPKAGPQPFELDLRMAFAKIPMRKQYVYEMGEDGGGAAVIRVFGEFKGTSEKYTYTEGEVPYKPMAIGVASGIATAGAKLGLHTELVPLTAVSGQAKTWTGKPKHSYYVDIKLPDKFHTWTGQGYRHTLDPEEWVEDMVDLTSDEIVNLPESEVREIVKANPWRYRH